MIDNKTIRKVIMLNKMLPGGSPTYENREASGAVANFTTNTVQPFVKCECEILPIQEGTGTPSPSNPRPISGTNELTLTHTTYRTAETYIIDLGQEIMGGTADFVGGTGEETYIKHEFSSSEIISDNYIVLNSSTNVWYWTQNNLADISGIDSDATHYCNVLKQDANAYNGGVANAFRIISGNRFYITLSADDYPTKADFKNAIDALKPVMVLKKATPTEYTFTGQPINSYLGVNNVWTNVGDTKVTYKYMTGEGGSTKKKYLPIFYDFYGKGCRHL